MLVTKLAPDFKAPAVLGNNEVDEHFELSKNLGRSGAILFFWPKILLLYALQKSLRLTKE